MGDLFYRGVPLVPAYQVIGLGVLMLSWFDVRRAKYKLAAARRRVIGWRNNFKMLVNFQVIQTKAELLSMKARLGRWIKKENPRPQQLELILEIQTDLDKAMERLQDLEDTTN